MFERILFLAVLQCLDNIGRSHNPCELAVKVGQRHSVNFFRRMDVPVGSNAIECPRSVTYKPGIEAEIASHTGSRFDAVIRRCSANHDRLDSGCTQPAFQVCSYECAVYSLNDDRLTIYLPGLVFYLVARLPWEEGGVRLRSLMSNVEYRRASRPECRKQLSDMCNCVSIIPALARCLPLVKSALYINHDKGWAWR
jgi:hypothetical protein